jgi:hypothetical protein
VISCVIPPELADELYDKLVDHYNSNPNVQVIIDRRVRDRRAGEVVSEEDKNRREIRDRRRDRPGTFPTVNDGAPAAAAD